MTKEEEAHWEAVVELKEGVLSDINTQILQLETSRMKVTKDLEQARLRVKGIEPCKACGRLVASPCNDRSGFQENGPWDFFCREILYG